VFLRTPGGVAGTAAQCGSGEFPTEWIKATPTVLCGTYHPTFLYELVWDVLVALVVVWADRRFRLGHGRAFALYVAGYCVGRGWIEMLRIDHANHILGLRLNVFVAAAVFLAAVIYLIATHRLTREDPATVYGIVPQGRGAPPAGQRSGERVEGGDDAADDASTEGETTGGDGESGGGGDPGRGSGPDGGPGPDGDEGPDPGAEPDDDAAPAVTVRPGGNGGDGGADPTPGADPNVESQGGGPDRT
jgi:hypothetical protein